MPADDAPAWRLFLAVDLPEDVRAGLDRPRVALEPLSGFVRAGAPESIHLTLHFLGQVAVAKVEPLSRRLRALMETVPRFSLDVAGVGAFPSAARPSVIWVGVGGIARDRLLALQAAIGTVLTDLGFAVETRPYTPHLTLARARRPPKLAERPGLRQWLEEWKGVGVGVLPVDEVRLMRSQLAAGPPRYSTIATFPLQ